LLKGQFSGVTDIQLDVKDLRSNPLTEMAGCHRPLDEPCQFGVDRIAFAEQRCGLCQRTFIHSRKSLTWHRTAHSSQYDDWPFPARWRGTRDFGPSKFGRYPGDPARYSGRRVDFLGRSLPVRPDADLAAVLRSYLAGRRTRSAKELAAKAAVLIDPENRVGEIVWPAVSRVSLRLLAPIDVLGPVLPAADGLVGVTCSVDRRGTPARVGFRHSRFVLFGGSGWVSSQGCWFRVAFVAPCIQVAP